MKHMSDKEKQQQLNTETNRRRLAKGLPPIYKNEQGRYELNTYEVFTSPRGKQLLDQMKELRSSTERQPAYRKRMKSNTFVC